MVGKLALNSTHFTMGLVKYVPGRGYFRVVLFQNGDKFATSPTSPIVERLISTRHDISNAVRSDARYRSVPKAIHWRSVLGILAYINGTCGIGIKYQRGTTVGILLEVFADADYASKATDGRSMSGGAIMCGGECVCWFSRTQKCVILFTSEAKYVALGDAVKKFLFLR